MTKVTWAVAVAFLATSVTLTIVAAQNAAGGSIVDALPVEDGAVAPPPGESLLPPSTTDAPLLPPRSE